MPRFSIMNPNDQDPEKAQLVQTYMVLTAKQTSVRRRLSSPPSYSPPASGSSSPDLSPLQESRSTPVTRPAWRHTMPASPKSPSGRSQSLRRPSVPSIPETLEEHDIDSDEGKLHEINQRIKSTLVALMNCESVKRDERMRSWVQTRLDSHMASGRHSRQASASSSPARSHSRPSSSQGSAPTYAPTYADTARHDGYTRGEMVRKLSI